MDYTAHVNNLAFLEVLNVLLAMAKERTNKQKIQIRQSKELTAN